MINQQLTESQFVLLAAIVLIAMAIVGTPLMTWAGVSTGQIGLILAVILTGAGQMLAQYRAIAVFQRTADDAAHAASQVKSALIQSDANSSAQLAEIQATGKATHALVNSGHIAALRSNVLLSSRIAELTGDEADKDVAARSVVALNDHLNRQAIVDIEQIKARSEGRPQA